MIVSWISYDNRKARRAKLARARRQLVELAIYRVGSQAVGDHIVALTGYLASPSKKHLDALAGHEAARQHIAHYIGSQKQPRDLISDAEIEHARSAADGERVLQVLTRNLISEELADIQFEMAAIAGLSPAGEDPIEHIVLSWPSDERPTPDQVEDALDILLSVGGISRHQTFATLHGDTDNIHLHVALNRVDPATGERRQVGLEFERSIETLHQAVAIIEHRQGWVPQEGSLYRADKSGCYERASGIKVRDADMYPCASDADRKRIRTLRARDKAERKITSEAANFERRTGLESLQRRVIEGAAPILRAALSWDEVHRRLAAEGMRYRMLTAGAVIECGDRAIAASTAWGGASAAKMTERLGEFAQPPADCAVPLFEDRVIPTLHRAAEQRRARERLRQDRQGLVESADGAARIFGDRYQAELATDPRSAGEELNVARRDASLAVAPARDALELLLAAERARIKRRRARLAEGRLEEPAAEDEEEPAPRAMLIAANGAAAPLAQGEPIDEQFEVRSFSECNEYWRDEVLAFVERAERIDLVTADDASIRAALRVAHRKWGKVAAVGDRPFLDRLARIAVEEGIEVTNPELQDQIARLRQNGDLERRLAMVEASRAQQLPQSQTPAPIAKDLSAVLADYAPQFTQWLELRADLSVPRANVDAAAMAIIVDPRLRPQLAELESQQFSFAAELRRAGQRYGRTRSMLVEQWALDDAPWSPEPPEVSELASSTQFNDAVAQGMVSLAPLASPTLPAVPSANGVGPAAEKLAELATRPNKAAERPRAAPDVANPATEPDPELEIDHRYRAWADRRRGESLAHYEREIAAALRARVGDEAALPRHIATLLLREGRRQPSERSSFGKATDQRDAADIAALSRDTKFARLLAAVHVGDQELTRRLQRHAGGEGDALGRVPLAGGRLAFGHVSLQGHDPGARPPLEWIQDDLAALDFGRIRLTRHKGLIGMVDTNLLEAVHYNYVGLLYPQTQAQLEVEWRLQRERDRAALARIQSGEIVVRATIELDPSPYTAIHVVRGGAPDERRHIEGMSSDAVTLLECRVAQRGYGVNQPRAASPLIAAYLRAQDEDADANILTLLTERLRTEKPALTDVKGIDRLAIEQAITPIATQAIQSRGKVTKRRWRQPSLPGGRGR